MGGSSASGLLKSVGSIASIVTVSIVKKARALLQLRSGRLNHRAITSDMVGRSFASEADVCAFDYQHRHFYMCERGSRLKY